MKLLPIFDKILSDTLLKNKLFKQLSSDIEISRYFLFLSENMIIDPLTIKFYEVQPLKNLFLWNRRRTVLFYNIGRTSCTTFNVTGREMREF